MEESVDGVGNLNAFVALRLMQICAYAADLAATPRTSQGAKAHALGELIQATRAIPASVTPPVYLLGLERMGLQDPFLGCSGVMKALASHLSEDDVTLAMLDLAVSTDWPDKVPWVLDRDEALAAGAALIDDTILPEHLTDLGAMHRRAFKRLRKDSVSPSMQVTLGAVLAGAALMSGGISQAVGTAVGTHLLGYSGAAATSAGLALLGGGSLAAGGFGMAGGMWLVGEATRVVGRTSVSLAARVALESTVALLRELAKLDVAAELLPHRQAGIVAGLLTLEHELQSQLADVRPHDLTARRVRTAKSVGKLLVLTKQVEAFNDLRRNFPPGPERNAAAACRAVDFEIRHLQATNAERWAYKVPRFLGAPGLAKLRVRG